MLLRKSVVLWIAALMMAPAAVCSASPFFYGLDGDTIAVGFDTTGVVSGETTFLGDCLVPDVSIAANRRRAGFRPMGSHRDSGTIRRWPKRTSPRQGGNDESQDV